MFELALREWHVTPEYICEHWTEELLCLMCVKRNEWMRKMNRKESDEPEVRKVSNTQFFSSHGIKVKRIQS